MDEQAGNGTTIDISMSNDTVTVTVETENTTITFEGDIDEITDALGDLQDLTTDELAEFFGNLGEIGGDAIDELAEFFGNLGEIGEDIANSVVDELAEFFGNLGEIFGDPHLTTFDGLKYDFHALGEYTFIESVDEDFEIQILTEQKNGSNNSFVTGIATNVGENIIEFNSKWETISIDGESNSITEETPLTLEEGVISVDTSKNRPIYTINYFSGETLVIDDIHSKKGADFFNVDFFAGDTDVVGLLGNNNGDTSDDIALRDGTVLSQPVDRDIIDGELADSWAVSPEDSLFNYLPKETIIEDSDIVNLPVFKANIAAISNAGFVNVGGFFKAIDADGTVIDPISGEEVAVGEEGYKTAALANSVTELGDGDAITVELEGGFVYVPYLLANGEEFLTAFAEVNADGLEHVQSVGDNTFGFEDLLGGGDNDFDDYLISFEVV